METGTPSTSSKVSTSRKRFVVKKWNAVALWDWDIEVDNCVICLNHIMEPCNHCLEAGVERTANVHNCDLSRGECGHAFHFHCISRWLKSKQTCPLDNGIWEFKKH